MIKRRRRKNKRINMNQKVIMLSIISILFITVAYAGFQENLYIQGNTTVSNPVFHFDYTGNVQTFDITQSGNYKIELWGASGGSISENHIPGRGGYVSGILSLKAGEKLFIYVGESGTGGNPKRNASEISNTKKEVFNGGGSGGTAGGPYVLNNQMFYYYHGNSGGGATDVRLTSGAWDSFNSLKSRIMVAAGGSGGSAEDTVGHAGGLHGQVGEKNISETGVDYSARRGVIGTQTSGYAFGIGGSGEDAPSSFCHGQSGGGGGYYGGGGAKESGGSCYQHSAAGGSSFISGYTGCNAISEASTENNIIHTGQSNHYSGKVFTNGIMIDGSSSMPNPRGKDTIIGNIGNGYAKITYLTEG